MTEELARFLVRPLLARHPLPWRIDYDWAVEVYDSKDQIVIKLMTATHATELIAFAEKLAAYDAQGAAEVKKLLQENGIDDDDDGA